MTMHKEIQPTAPQTPRQMYAEENPGVGIPVLPWYPVQISEYPGYRRSMVASSLPISSGPIITLPPEMVWLRQNNNSKVREGLQQECSYLLL